jgi:hypothetical protein
MRCGGQLHAPMRIRRPGSIERIFATKAALTKPLIEAGTRRSHFGRSDSWFIKMRGRQFLPREFNK